MLKTPSPFRSRRPSRARSAAQSGTSESVEAALSARGSGVSPVLMRVFSRTSAVGLPRLFHITPESRTAIVTSGRPVVVAQACGALPSWSTTHAPRTPFSSRLSATSGLVGEGGDDAYIHTRAPLRSFGRGAVGGRRKLV